MSLFVFLAYAFVSLSIKLYISSVEEIDSTKYVEVKSWWEDCPDTKKLSLSLLKTDNEISRLEYDTLSDVYEKCKKNKAKMELK